MNWKLLTDDPGGRRYVLVFSPGDEIMAEVKRFAEAERLRAAEFTGIGALESAKLAAFDPEAKEYVDIPVNEQTELASMNGRITLPKDSDVDNPPDERQLHVHCTLARRDGSAIGGHVLEATVRPTCEVFVSETAGHLARREDDYSGLPVIWID